MLSEAKVILVEDDPLLLESMLECLTLEGMRVTGVASGVEFLARIAENTFQVAVIDVDLPDFSGLELATLCRQRTGIGIIMLTSLDSPQDCLSGYEAGCDLYLTKPVDIPLLFRAISNLAERQETNWSGMGSSKEEAWSLDLKTWRLYPPDGDPISLTAKERFFLKLLGEAEGDALSRSVLIAALYPRIDAYTSRSLDSLLSRLRGKVLKSSGETLPVKSAYGKGLFCLSWKWRIAPVELVG